MGCDIKKMKSVIMYMKFGILIFYKKASNS
jgi:hypothetical protein